MLPNGPSASPHLGRWLEHQVPEPGSPSRSDKDEPWVEISSRPSSSVSSAGEEVTPTTNSRASTGASGAMLQRLRRRFSQSGNAHDNTNPQPHSQVTRLRRPLRTRPHNARLAVPQKVAALDNTSASSHDEREDGESEDDQLLTLESSTEKIAKPVTMSQRALVPYDTDSDSEYGGTAVGSRGRAAPRKDESPPPFQPQPDVFSHPPSTFTQLNHPHAAVRGNAAWATPAPLTSTRFRTARNVIERGGGGGGGGGGAMLPSGRFVGAQTAPCDPDAALKASLTTLLSCAAAARNLREQQRPQQSHWSQQPERGFVTAAAAGAGGSSRSIGAVAANGANRGISPGDQPVELMLVQEDQLLADESRRRYRTSPGSDGAAQQQLTTKPTATRGTTRRRRSNRSGSDCGALEQKDKNRATSTSTSSLASSSLSVVPDQHYNARVFISPTLFAWVVSAGVVVLVSVVGFGAGFAFGRQLGRHEATRFLLRAAPPSTPLPATIVTSGFNSGTSSVLSSLARTTGSECARSTTAITS